MWFDEGGKLRAQRASKIFYKSISKLVKAVETAQRHSGHADDQVRKAARSLLRGISQERMNFDTASEAGTKLRGRVRKSGMARKRNTPIHPAHIIPSGDGAWSLVRSVKELNSFGRALNICTTAGNSHAKEYEQRLRNENSFFYVLLVDDEPLALADYQADLKDLDQVSGPMNAPYTDRSKLLDLVNGIEDLESCSSLLEHGIVSGFFDIDISEPDLTIGKMALWLRGDRCLTQVAGHWLEYKAKAPIEAPESEDAIDFYDDGSYAMVVMAQRLLNQPVCAPIIIDAKKKKPKPRI
jgi:hypothetical protein